MSSVEIRRELLELEKLRQEIETELAKRHNWGQQEEFWRVNADFWAHEAKMSRGRNYIALAAIVAAITASVTAALAKLL